MPYFGDTDLHLTGERRVGDAPAPLPFPRGDAEREESSPMNDWIDSGRRPERVDTDRIMATLTELEDGLAGLRAEAEEIDEMLEPLNFSRFKAAWDRDDDGPWAA